MNHIELRRFGIRQLWIGLLICIGVFAVLGVRVVWAAEIKCSAVNYCETEIDLSDQKAPIVYDGTGNWLDAFEKYFDADVFLVSGSEKKPVSDAALIFACSVDGVAFDSCQAGQFIEPGTYTLRVSVEEDTERFYLPVYRDTKVTIQEADADDGLTIAYRSGEAESGTVVEDWTAYRRGDKAVILGNFGIGSDGNPDPLVRSGFMITGWRDASGRTYRIGEEIIMEKSIELTPIWTSEEDAALSASAASAAVPEPMPTDPGAGSKRVDDALLAKAATFYPVRPDGGKSDPVLLVGAKALKLGTDETDGIQTWNPHVLDGFYAPDGSEVSLTLGNPIPSEPNSSAETVAESMNADAAIGSGDSAYDGTAAPVALSDALNDSPFEAMPLPEEDFSAGSGSADFADGAAEAPAETTPADMAIEASGETTFERVAAAEELSPFEDGAPAPDSDPQPVPALASALPPEAGPFTGANAGQAVQAELKAAASPVAKQANAYVPGPNQDDPYDQFDVSFPQTGFVRLSDAPVAALPSTGMQLELPAANITAEIVVVPFAGNTWDVSSLRSQAGVLEGFDLPGDGVSILAGHNHLGPDQAGPFLTIGTLEIGDRVFVRKDDGTILTFEVYENRLVAPDEFETIETLTVSNPGSIVLVTCENESVEGGYTDRRAVFARPVDG